MIMPRGYNKMRRPLFPGVRRIPYRVTVGNGAPQTGEIAVDFRPVTRWWVSRWIKAEPSLEQPGTGSGGFMGEIISDIAQSDRSVGVPEDLFKRDGPPEGWKQAEYGAGESIPFSGPLPLGSIALAATRLMSPAESEAVIGVKHDAPGVGSAQGTREPLLTLRIWINGKVVYNSRSIARDGAKPFRILKGGNTMVMACQSNGAVGADPGSIVVDFKTARDGARLKDLVFVIGK